MLIARVPHDTIARAPHDTFARAPHVTIARAPHDTIARAPHDTFALIGARAERAMLLELFTHPKPGLVSHCDRGSHADMDAAMFRASAAAIRPFMSALAAAGAQAAPMDALRRIGLAAEAAMMQATGGINTHRGAIFGLGLLCAAAGRHAAAPRCATLGETVAAIWGREIGATPAAPDSHGSAALRRHGGGGAREEAAAGFPTIYRVGLPALRDGTREAARIQCLFALLATVHDTTLLHRGGAEGLAFAQTAAARFLERGGIRRPGWRADALALHRAFVARNLSAGGSADLLAMTLFVALTPACARAARFRHAGRCRHAARFRHAGRRHAARRRVSDPVALLCSGQGGQHRDMFAWLGAVPAAEPVFAAASSLLGGLDPRRFVREAPDDALFGNHAGQILCCTQALAAWAMLGDARPSRVVLAGYSVGELAAWGCAGVFAPDALLRLAAERARLMDAAAPAGAGLAAIVGLRRPALERLLATHGAALAIVNGADSVVIGGTADALEACLAEATRQGAATARRLPVAVPSHTALLAAASAGFAPILATGPHGAVGDGVRLLSGIDGEVVRDPARGLHKLAAQISTTIEWSACLAACRELGASRFLELGPGTALSRMVEQSGAGASARAIEQFRTPDGVRSWLARA